MTVPIPELPLPLRWLTEPEAFENNAGALTIAAGPRCDLFVDPAGSFSAGLAAPPMLLGDPDGDFTLSARVSVTFASSYDAGVLVLYRDESCWAKLCFERSPQGDPMVVSVVTRRVSDDSNHFTVDGSHVWLRVLRSGDSYAFHASRDGERWQLVRYFGLDPGAVSVGFEAQSPTGEGCRATFDEIRYVAGAPGDMRAGG